MDRPNTSSEGSLFELVARGEKDKYFISDKLTASVPFSYNMATWPATLDETRQTQAFNAIDFGRTVEWEMDAFGDLLVSAAFVIDLPTWLPIAVAPLIGPLASWSADKLAELGFFFTSNCTLSALNLDFPLILILKRI